MVKGGMEWGWSQEGRKNEFVEGKGQHGKQFVRNEVTITQYVLSSEAFKTLSVVTIYAAVKCLCPVEKLWLQVQGTHK